MLLLRAVAALLRLPESLLHFRFCEHRYLGAGAWAFVVLATERSTGSPVAVKVIPPWKLGRARQRESAAREAAILAGCKHPNIVRFLNAFADEDNVYICVEPFEHGTLEQLLRRRRRPLSEAGALRIFAQLLRAVEYLHARGVVHRDLSAANIGLQRGVVKLFDFGLSAVRAPGERRLSSEFYGTTDYWAPEICARRPHVPERAEMWACGAILLALLAPPRRGRARQTPRSAAHVRRLLCSPALAHVSDNTRWLLARLLHPEPAERPTAAQARLFLDGMLAAGRPSLKAETVDTADANASATTPATVQAVALEGSDETRRAHRVTPPAQREHAVIAREHQSQKWKFLDKVFSAFRLYFKLFLP